jgi:hypothetical protein
VNWGFEVPAEKITELKLPPDATEDALAYFNAKSKSKKNFLQWTPDRHKGTKYPKWFDDVRAKGQEAHDTLMKDLPPHLRRSGKLVYFRVVLLSGDIRLHMDERATGNYHLVLARKGKCTIERFDLDGTCRFDSNPGTGYMFDGTNAHRYAAPLEDTRLIFSFGFEDMPDGLDLDALDYRKNTTAFFHKYPDKQRAALLHKALDPAGSPGFHLFQDVPLFAPGPLLNAILYCLRLGDLFGELFGPLWTDLHDSRDEPAFLSADFTQLSPKTLKFCLEKLDAKKGWSKYLLYAWDQHRLAVRRVLMDNETYILKNYFKGKKIPPMNHRTKSVPEHTHSLLRSSDGDTPQDLHMDICRMLALVGQVYLCWNRGQEQYFTDCGSADSNFTFPPTLLPHRDNTRTPNMINLMQYMRLNQFTVIRVVCANGSIAFFWAGRPHRGIPSSIEWCGARAWKSFFLFTELDASITKLFGEDIETQMYTWNMVTNLYPQDTETLYEMVAKAIMVANTTARISLDKVLQHVWGDQGTKPDVEHCPHQAALLKYLTDRGVKMYMPITCSNEITRNSNWLKIVCPAAFPSPRRPRRHPTPRSS